MTGIEKIGEDIAAFYKSPAKSVVLPFASIRKTGLGTCAECIWTEWLNRKYLLKEKISPAKKVIFSE